jgi:hypothetical protein
MEFQYYYLNIEILKCLKFFENFEIFDENLEFFWNLKFLNILKFSHFLKINYIFLDMFAFFAPLWYIDASIVFKRLLHDRLLNWPLNLLNFWIFWSFHIFWKFWTLNFFYFFFILELWNFLKIWNILKF